MKFSLLILSTLAAGVLAVPPGGGEDENHNSSQDVTLPLKDIPLTPDEPGYQPEEGKPTKSSSASSTPSPTSSKAPKKTDDGDLVEKLVKNLPLGDLLSGI